MQHKSRSAHVGQVTTRIYASGTSTLAFGAAFQSSRTGRLSVPLTLSAGSL